MAYSATVGSFKKAMVETRIISDISYSATQSLTYVDIFRQYMYWNDVKEIDYGLNLGETGGNTISVKITKNGTTISEINVNSANAWGYGRSLNIPAAAQDYGLMQISIKTDNAATVAWVKDYKVYARAV